jgi:hypothetical protein
MADEPEDALDPELRERALDLLEAHLTRVETTPRRPIDPNLVRTEADQAVVNVSVAFEALASVGLVGDEDREHFFGRLREITSTAYAPFRGIALERVVPAPPHPDVPGLHLLAAEIYGDGVVLRWVFVAPQSARDTMAGDADHQPPQTFALWDDAGTAYTPQGGGWVPGHHLRGDTAFVPTVPPSATRLHVAADRHRYELALS